MQQTLPVGGICPLCQRQNDCAVAAAGGREVHCWCMDLPGVTLQMPRSAQSSCLCRQCIEREDLPRHRLGTEAGANENKERSDREEKATHRADDGLE
jgi:hypothetical protein